MPTFSGRNQAIPMYVLYVAWAIFIALLTLGLAML